ncbi:MAG: membrane protein insertion efficiency factor YidD [Candidatus Binatota bacterium]
MHTPGRVLLSRCVLLAIEFYRNILSIMMLHSCRFQPTCSEYASDAIRKHGALRGGWRAARRILRCHPLARGEFDPAA